MGPPLSLGSVDSSSPDGLLQDFLSGGPSGGELEPGLALSFHHVTSPPDNGWRGRRVTEYLAGRAAAHDALLRAGHHGPATLETTPAGAARWPAGFSGSIAHTAVLAAAVAWSEGGPIGIDLEAANTVPRSLLDICCSWELLGHLDAETSPTLATIVFSAKEAAFKALSPLSGPTTIREIEVRSDDLHRHRGRFQAWHQHSPDVVLSGSFSVTSGVVLTMAVPSPAN